MRAAVLRQQGGVPEPGEFQAPRDRGGCEVISVEAAGLNPVDLAIAAGAFSGPQEVPLVPGREGIGETKGGRRVYFDTVVQPHGSFAEAALAPGDQLIDVPEGISAEAALPFGIAGMAGWLGLTWKGRLEKGESVLVLGSNSVVGQVAVQAARVLGAGRITAAARNEEGLLRGVEQGATDTVPLGGEDRISADLREASGDGFDLVIDALGGAPGSAALAAMAENGRLIQIGSSAGPTLTITNRPFRLASLSVIGLINFAAPIEVRKEAFTALCRLALDGEILIETESVPLERIGEAWRRQQEGPRRKLVIPTRGSKVGLGD